MITQEILNTIFQKNLAGETIQAKELMSLGVNYNDINKLINDGVIQRIERGIYGLSSFDALYNFGIFLMEAKEYSKAFEVFYKCHSINPNHLETCEYMLFLRIKIKKKKQVYELLEKMQPLINPKNNNLYNIYLYLSTYTLGGVTKSISEKVKGLKLEDLSLNQPLDINEYDLPEYDLSDVLKAIGNFEENENLSEIQKQIIRELIIQCKETQKRLREELLNLAQQKKYEKIISILQYKDRQINLDPQYKNILTIANTIQEMLTTEKKPIQRNSVNFIDNISWLIENRHFKRALKLKKQMIKESSDTYDIEYLLLIQINELIVEITKKEKLENAHIETTGNPDIDNIIRSLKYRGFKQSIDLIKEYLKQIGKEEYESLTLNLIRISWSECNAVTPLVLSTLIELSKDEYVYCITPYLREFYSKILENKLLAAKQYLNIIKCYSSELPSIISSLEQDIVNAEKRIENQNKDIKQYLLQVLEQMKQNKKAIVILEQMPHPTRKMIYSIIKGIPELIAFSIGEEPKRVVLRYLNPELAKKQQKTLDNIINKQITAFNEGDYAKSIEIGKYLLSNPAYGGYNPTVYQTLGLSYNYLRNKEEANMYLTISKEIAKGKEKKSQNKKQKSICTSKTSVANTENSPIIPPEDELDDNFGITNIEEIAYYIQMEKMPIQTACQQLNLTEEQIQLVKLIYARDYYIESMYPQGDRLLQEVEKSKNKTKKVKDLLTEIRNRKLFYKNIPNAYTRKRIMPTSTN